MIEVNKLNKTYDRRTRSANPVLHDVTFDLPDKGFVCILGPSGCGKTSLLNALGGLDTFDSGSLTVDELTVSRYGTRAFELARDRNFGYIFQNYYLLPEHSVAYNVYLGLHSLGLSHAEKVRRVRLALKAVDMERYIRRKVEELSGGQQQRVAIARALARRPRVIFADEPTGNLDEDNTRAVCTLLRRASKDSLVVMVTHEERIARFFADRIITLSDGRIVSDSSSWERRDLEASSGNTIYTGDLEEHSAGAGAVTLRLFEEPGAAPAQVTVAVLRDRIVLKVSDSRTAVLGEPEDFPRIVEGPRPAVDFEKVDGESSTASAELFGGGKAPLASPGKGLTASMMAREAWGLRRGGKMRRAGTWAFLVLLTVFALILTGDFIHISRVDPEDFLTADPHMLSFSIDQGPKVIEMLEKPRLDFAKALNGALRDAGFSYDFIPPITAKCEFSVSTFYQMGALSVSFPSSMAYAPVDGLDPAALLYGRMPEKNYEIVVDRQVLEAMLKQDDLILNSIRDLSYFLDAEIDLVKRSYPLTICGISDSGSRTVYISKSAMLAMCNGGAKIMSLDELRELFPGRYDGMTLAPDECLVNVETAGYIWESRVGSAYKPGGTISYKVKDLVYIDDVHYAAVLSDEAIEARFLDLLTESYQIYCSDKAAMLPFIRDFIDAYEDRTILPSVTDRYAIQQRAFEEAASLRMDARSIVTLTVLALCLVMLYLLCRTQARERLGLVAVYRLLGIPGRKLCVIFLLEAFFSSLAAVVPAAFLTWAGVAALHRWTSAAASILLPWPAAVLAGLGIICYYLLVSVLPLISLLSLPPARLAARYE